MAFRSREAAPAPDTIRERDLRAVVERAMKLDTARKETLTVAEVERIGDELGISREAMRSALAELRGARHDRADRRETWHSRLRDWFRSAAMGAAALGGGWFIGGKDEPLNFLLFLGTVAAALYYRHEGKERRYLRDMIAIWAGFGIGWFIASGMISEGDTGFHLVVPGLAGVTIGAILLRVRWPFGARLRSGETASDSSDGTDRGTPDPPHGSVADGG